MRKYVRLVEQGCDLLTEIQDETIQEDKREKIFSQREQELLAYAAYTSARERLWTVLSDSDPRLPRVDVNMGRKTRRASS
jgi:hypothetical protein